MTQDPPVAEMMQIAASSVPLLDRARSVVEELDRWLAVDGIWLTLSDPESNVYAVVGDPGLGRSVLDHPDGPAVGWGTRRDELDRHRAPIRVTGPPVAARQWPPWADRLISTGLHEAVDVPLVEPDGGRLGMLNLLFPSEDAPSAGLRSRIGEFAPLIAWAVSPMRSLLVTAGLVRDAGSGAVVLRDGATHPLPGLSDHPLLGCGSPVLELARRILLAGEVYRTFMWPVPERSDPHHHARITILTASDVPPFVLGTLLVSRRGYCRGLTPREMEVLGLIVAGRTNQQIARLLAVAPRTVAAHVEHILHKLDACTRTLAAVKAVREGCYVPLVPGIRPPPA